jgi:transcriptional regulator with XRE-family HTH domain
MITASQCRAARALLDWSQQQLASTAQVGVVTVRQFEGGGAQPRPATLDVVTRALEAAGVEFIPENGGGAGVRLRRLRTFEEVSLAGLTTGRVAFVADQDRFNAAHDSERWREIPFNSDNEIAEASGFKRVMARACTDGFTLAKRE